jgi:Sec-independent protein translocase protein TatA
MKKTISIFLLPLSALPAVGQDFEKCIKQFQAEANSIAEIMKGLDKQSADISERRRNAKTKPEQDALKSRDLKVKAWKSC